MYDSAFHARIEREERPQADRLARYLSISLRPVGVVDYGCSTGFYLRPWLRLNRQRRPERRWRQGDIWGYDSSPEAVHHRVADCVQLWDLRKIVPRRHPHSLAICLEVLEHIPDEDSDTVLNNLTRDAAWILFSAAQPGQPGVGHVNCRPPEYWKSRICRYGFGINNAANDDLLDYLRQGKCQGWLLRNVVLFHRDGVS